MIQKTIRVDTAGTVAAVFGPYDVNVREIERVFPVSVHHRETQDGYDCILLSGDHKRSGRVIFLRQLLRPGIGGVDDRIVKNLLSDPRGLADTF